VNLCNQRWLAANGALSKTKNKTGRKRAVNRRKGRFAGR
jgi:hypothetical protein